MVKSPSDAAEALLPKPEGLAAAGPETAGESTSPVEATARRQETAVPTSLLDSPAAAGAVGSGLVRLAVLDKTGCRDLAGPAAIAELPKALSTRGAWLWLDLCSAGPELKTAVSSVLGLHPLLVEDLTERDQRAKLEKVGELLHVVMFSLGFEEGEIYERELDFVLGERFLLTSHSVWWDPRQTRHLRSGLDEVAARGPGHLLWCLCDDIIDDYFPILDQLGDEIDELEDKVVGRANRALLERLFDLKRQLIQVRRVTSPEREMFNVLSNREEKSVSADDRLYFRDAYDHLIRLTDELDTYRELASATLEAYLSTVNNNLSLIMKRLTGVTVVLAGIGMVAGIFGMSEASVVLRGQEGPGFWLILAGTLILAAIATAILRRIDWI